VNAAALVAVDDAFVVVDKPAGLPAVPGRAESLRDCLAARVQRTISDALVVHRLDMATSGLMLFARGRAAQRAIARAFELRRVGKRYVAVVAGRIDRDEGEIDLPVGADWPNRPRQAVDRVRGRPALTRYRVLERDAANDTTRVALEPVTGRTHQLRVHLAAIGHPIVGDALYAPEGPQPPAARLLLHASALHFAHLRTGEPVAVTSAPPF
jgi:tRNA pseudouridine32 synthase/23S rRNA pseudouridine746 synthase